MENFRKTQYPPLGNCCAAAADKDDTADDQGRGILDIFTLCKEAGLPEPEYDFVPNFVCLTIRFKEPITPHLSGDKKDDRINDKLNDRLNEELNAPARSTYLLVRENPGIQRKGLSEKSGKSIPTIDRHLAELQEKGFVMHEGSKKTGGYYAKE